MVGTHGDLFDEIGQLVFAADAGRPIDLTAASEDLAERYDNLGFPPAIMARAIARSLGAIGVSMALMAQADQRDDEARALARIRSAGSRPRDSFGPDMRGGFSGDEDQQEAQPASVVLPSGIRVAVLS